MKGKNVPEPNNTINHKTGDLKEWKEDGASDQRVQNINFSRCQVLYFNASSGPTTCSLPKGRAFDAE